MKVVIPGNFLNWNEYIRLERSNLYAANSIKQEEKKIVALFAREKYTGDYPVEIIFRPYFKNHRKDLDNTRIKGILDGLVACGVLKDDNLTYVQRVVFEPIFTKKTGLEIEINSLK